VGGGGEGLLALFVGGLGLRVGRDGGQQAGREGDGLTRNSRFA
jgi:hypothetical protein